jgi:hypothetical protein
VGGESVVLLRSQQGFVHLSLGSDDGGHPRTVLVYGFGVGAAVQWAGVVLGSAFCIVAVVLFELARRASRAPALMEATPTVTCESLQSTPWESSAQQVIEVVGRARTLDGEEPLHGEFSGKPCVWYRSVIVEDYWDWEYDPGEQASSRMETYRLIYDFETDRPFRIDDGTGSVHIHPAGATVEVPLVLYEKEEDEKSSWKDRFLNATFGNGENVIGHRRQEWAIYPDDELYVLGAVAGEAGSVRIERPTADGADFLLTSQPEADVVADRRGSVRPYAVAGASAGVFGVFFLAVGVLA